MRSKKNIHVRIGANIQSAREQANYTQERLAEVIGITPNHLSAIERGASGASLELIEKLCNHFQISADSLFFGKQEEDDSTMAIARQLGQVKTEYRPQVHKVLSALLEVLALQKQN